MRKKSQSLSEPASTEDTGEKVIQLNFLVQHCIHYAADNCEFGTMKDQMIQDHLGSFFNKVSADGGSACVGQTKIKLAMRDHQRARNIEAYQTRIMAQINPI